VKEKILQKAEELFLTFGFKSVTMDDIANKMGISKKTIYTHFKNKTQLVKETTLKVFENISQGIDCICSLNKNPIDEIFEIKTLILEQLKGEKTSPQYQLSKYYPEIHNTLKKRQFDIMQDCVKNNLTKGVSQGYYRADLAIEFISRIYFLGMTGIKDENIFPSDKFSKKQVMENYLEYHLRGIVTKKGLSKLNQIINKN
jgi:AcrR family transcriptional regulator